jgi:hypothetical protein
MRPLLFYRRLFQSNDSHGYTLIETVLSLVVLMAVAVPMLSRLYRGFMIADTRLEVTGTWLLEQEAAIINMFPSTMLPVKRRYINGTEWTIRAERQRAEPAHYLLTAEVRGKECATVHFYGRANDAKK